MKKKIKNWRINMLKRQEIIKTFMIDAMTNVTEDGEKKITTDVLIDFFDIIQDVILSSFRVTEKSQGKNDIDASKLFEILVESLREECLDYILDEDECDCEFCCKTEESKEDSIKELKELKELGKMFNEASSLFKKMEGMFENEAEKDM